VHDFVLTDVLGGVVEVEMEGVLVEREYEVDVEGV
jgi:hypothetical protein